MKHELGNLKQIRVDVKHQICHTNVSYRNPCNIENHQTNSLSKALTNNTITVQSPRDVGLTSTFKDVT